jgi:hypothetical protein
MTARIPAAARVTERMRDLDAETDITTGRLLPDLRALAGLAGLDLMEVTGR